jgi:hypothetical protein
MQQKQRFIQEAIVNDESAIQNIDTKNGIITFLDNEGQEGQYFFTSYLNRQLSSLFEKLEIDIEEAFCMIDDEVQRIAFIKYLNQQIHIIVNPKKWFFDAYPSCRLYINQLISFLNEVHQCEIDNPIERLYPSHLNDEAPFRIRNKFDKRSKLVSLYDLLINEEIIDDEMISESDFIDVISGSPTKSILIFKVKNGVAINFLESISHIYEAFNGRIVEESNRFYTKQKNVIKQDNYNTSKSRFSPKDEQVINKIAKAINKLFPQ